MRWFKQHFILTTLLTITILLALTVALTSQIATYLLRSYLSDYASDIAIERLTISWLRSDIRLQGLRANNLAGDKFVINDLYVDWNMSDLWDENLIINTVSVSGFEVDVKSDRFNPTHIGPIPLPQATSETENPDPAKPWSVNVSDVTLNEIKVCINDTYSTSDVALPLNESKTIDHCLSFSKFELSEPLTITKSQQISLMSPIVLSDLNITERDSLSLASIGAISLDPLIYEDNSINLQSLQLEDLQLLSSSSNDISSYGLAIDTIRADGLSADLNSSNLMLTNGQLTDLVVMHRAADGQLHEMVAFSELSLQESNLHSHKLSLTALAINRLKLLEQLTGSDSGHIVTLDEFLLSAAEQVEHELILGDIQMNSLATTLVMLEEGMNISRWLPESEEVEVEAEIAEEVPATHIRLNSLRVEGSSAIAIVDNTLGKPLRHTLSELNLSVGAFETLREPASEKAETPLNFSMKYGPTGTINGTGKLIWTNSLEQLYLTGEIKRFDLVGVSDYASRHIGYRIDSGSLNLDYEVALVNDQLDVNLKTLFEKFELGSLQEHEKNELNEELGLPLPLALNLLRDRDNNIELELPIKGSVDDPQFSIADVVSTVGAKAIKQAVIYHYSPLGMLSMASAVFDLATALRFDPVQFAPGESSLDDEDRDRLQILADTMLQKPRITILVCAQATQLDLAMPVAESQNANEQGLTTEQTTQLIEMAKERQSLVINYLVEEHGIEAERLSGCNVKLASKKDAKPVVKLSI